MATARTPGPCVAAAVRPARFSRSGSVAAVQSYNTAAIFGSAMFDLSYQ